MKKVALFVLQCIGSLMVTFILAEIGTRIYLSIAGSSEEYSWEAASRWRGIHRLSDNPDLLYDLEPNSSISVDYGRLGKVNYHISSQGLRDKEYETPRPKGGVRILVLGDSVTFGYYVPAESTFVELTEQWLASQFDKIEVLNAGVGGYNTHNEIAWLMEHGLSLEPDIVILAFCPNDIDNPYFHFAWHTLDKLGPLPSRLLPDSSVMVGTRPDTPSGLVSFLGKRFKVASLIQQRLKILRNALTESAAKKGGEKAEKALSRLPFGDCLVSLCEQGSPRVSWLDKKMATLDSLSLQFGFRWGFLVLPMSYQEIDGPGGCARRTLGRLAAKHRVPFIDPLEAPPGSFSGLFYDVTHLSPAGHRWVARALCRQLELLTRTSHQLSAATTDMARLRRYALSASSTYRRGYACGVLGRKPCRRRPLGRFASKAGEKSGLIARPGSADATAGDSRSGGVSAISSVHQEREIRDPNIESIARTSHQPSATAADMVLPASLRAVDRPRRIAEDTPTASLRRKPCRQCPFSRFATKAGEKSGLARTSQS